MWKFCYTILIDPRLPPHTASYDHDGNILLPPEGPHAKSHHKNPNDHPADATIPSSRHPLHRHIGILRSTTRSLLDEGTRQYKSSIPAVMPLIGQGKRGARRGMGSLWGFLMQPVWIPHRKKKMKQYSRMTLIVLDIFRFGGTFAGMFLVLFVAINYQSFWEITKARFNALSPIVSEGLPGTVGGALSVGQGRVIDPRGGLLTFIPSIGPPENRIVIPKLGLNVPLVLPSFDALLRQDWTQVETDIQEALERGVVHYPGTARPGQAGNFFVTGHSAYYPWAEGAFKNVFARLHELQIGDEYFVYYGGDRHRYVVQSKKEVSPSDISVLDQPADSRIATLMTCTPVGTTLRRLIVLAQEVDPISGIALKVGEKMERTAQLVQPEALPI